MRKGENEVAHKAIREADGMRMLARLLKDYSDGKYEISDKVVTVTSDTDMTQAAKSIPMAENGKTGS